MNKAVYCIWLSLLLIGCRKELSDTLYPLMEISSSVAYEDLARTDEGCTVTLTDLHEESVTTEGTVRLRGNSTAEMPKKPFHLRFSHQQMLLGMPAAHSWVLLANYFDKTMLRNALAFRLSEESRLGWTPRSQWVALRYNGADKGVYQVCEKVEVGSQRLTVPEDGWLIEIDARVTEEDVFFRTPRMENPFRIDWPKKHLSKKRMSELQTFFTEAEEALFSDTFTDLEKGWRRFMDEDSWVDWLLINELAKNCDGNFYSSCYMHSTSDGKIAMGPLWDYDSCFGNCIWEEPRNPKGFYVMHTHWFTRLMEDPLYAAHVRERFLYYYNRQEQYYAFIRQSAAEIRPYIEENDRIWHTIGQSVSPYLTAYNTYDEDVEALIEWMKIRFEWLKNNL